MKDVVGSSETSSNIYHTIQCHVQESSHSSFQVIAIGFTQIMICRIFFRGLV
jgi:hypothetical protein